MTTLRPAGFAIAASLAFTPLAAADFLSNKERRAGTVTACSSYGQSECVSARIVGTSTGTKLRLKSGSLIDCAGDCRDALRRATVDFWHDQRERSR